MVLDGREDEANTIVCAVLQQLHAHDWPECAQTTPLPTRLPPLSAGAPPLSAGAPPLSAGAPPLSAGLPSLAAWFKSLASAAATHGGVFSTCQSVAERLLSDPRDIVTLHGDVHYDNILDSGSRGWVAIDPKGVIGERGFDYANLFCNPTIEVATSPARLPREIPLVAARAGLEPQRLLRWIIAWAGLMAAWMLEDAEQPTLPLLVAELALKELDIS
jgi:streptomycin 6-kinase